MRGVVYHLSYPNKEIKVSLNEHLFAYFTRMRGAEEEEIRSRLEEVLRQGRVEEFEEILRSLFVSIP
ncbi:MAG: hypothetical protein QXY41_07625 [Thermoproteota archaeon]